MARILPFYVLLLLIGPFAVAVASTPTGSRIIGATATLQEVSSGSKFLARVDTGAESCSLHVHEILVEGGVENMRENIGKKVRFQVPSMGKKCGCWIASEIHNTVIVKTSEKKERRYKVWLTLRYEGIEKRVLVTLNDRSHMEFPLLVGRNFLKGEFLVDVARSASD